MNLRARAGLGAAASAVTAALVLAAPASAAVAAPAPAAALPGASVRALPPYSTWIADVTAVADQASAYLGDVLPTGSFRPAIVLDIDNTALQTTYRPGLTSPATGPILEIARRAAADGAAVFFVTARPEILGWQTEINLDLVGYPVERVYLRPWFDTQPDAELKTGARKAIEAQGYRIVANIGNSASDLSGGHADRVFKLPDYDGQLI
ncbi:HAD family acid phosphatase [Couchioplanes azureus]|uniref:HAD family acid phosphatase n=1 Tax=Couchioplanes caeruleus TaxID=56438 RepID=UPI00166F91B4|nr:HAD family acid phosphatase [Couchioplanes caeruleus]